MNRRERTLRQGMDLERREAVAREQHVLAWLERIADQHPDFVRAMTAKMVPLPEEQRTYMVRLRRG